MTSFDSSLHRRQFIQGGTLAAMGAIQSVANAANNRQAQSAADTKTILNYRPEMKYRRLGDMDVHLSVISLGGLVISEPLHHYAIEKGVNLVHMSTSYLDGQAIQTLGKVMATRREQVYIALKDNFAKEGEFAPEALDKTLKILNTDYIDFLMFNRHDPASARDPKVLELFEKYKAQGKVRYAGMTVHGDIKGSIGAAIESGMYTLLNPILNQPNLEALDVELRDAYKKKMGVMAMKTMKGIEPPELETVYLKKILKNPAVTTVVKGITSFEKFDAYLSACQETLTSSEDRELYRYAQANRANNCMLCDECKRACPLDVEVSTVLRCNDYYWGQLRDRWTALSTYREVPTAQRGSEACGDCRKCEQVCPNGIPIVDRLTAARDLSATMV